MFDFMFDFAVNVAQYLEGFVKDWKTLYVTIGPLWVDKNTADSIFQQDLKIFGQRLMCVVGLLLLLPLPWQLITYQLGRLLGSTTKFTIYSK